MNSFSYALKGITYLVRNEHNARIHLIAAILALALGLAFRIDSTEWLVIIFAIGFVFVSELFNTAIEGIADFIEPMQDTRIATIKDCAAAAVLISAFVALVAGLIIFTPKILDTFSS